ncbi:MAG TPA: AI-2E family transporter [Methanocorpusculum sp.]|nr:AI-2E family transporter [Methanocorpusculum sp.]
MGLAYFLKNHTILVFLAILLIALTIISWKYLGIAIIAASLAVIGMPIHRKLRTKVPLPLSAALVTILICGIIVAILATIVVVLINNMGTLATMIDSILDWISSIFHITIPIGTGAELVNTLFSSISPQMAMSAISFGTFIVVSAILFFAILYLFFIFGEKIVNDIKTIIPEKSRPSMLLMGQKTKSILFSLYVVHVFIAVVTFAVAIPYCLIAGFGFGMSMFLATLCGIFALIPVVGPIVIIVFIGLYCISIGDWYALIITVTVGYFLTCIVTDMFLRPKLTAKSVKIRPMLMFIGFFGGAAVLGVIGFVLGPVLLVISLTGYEVFFKEMRTVKQEVDSAENGIYILNKENKS